MALCTFAGWSVGVLPAQEHSLSAPTNLSSVQAPANLTNLVADSYISRANQIISDANRILNQRNGSEQPGKHPLSKLAHHHTETPQSSQDEEPEYQSIMGLVSKLENRLAVEQSEVQLLVHENARLAHENERLDAMPTLSRPPKVGASTIMQHGTWYHLRRGLVPLASDTFKKALNETLASEIQEGSEEPVGTTAWWTFIAVVVALLAISGFASGLVVGLHSIHSIDLGVLELQGTPAEKAQAAQVRPLVVQHHRLLVTLLLVYVGASESLPIFIDKLIPDWAAILLSVTAILILGEVLPRAFCTGSNKLAIAAFCAPIVRFLMFVLAPVAWPLAKGLDRLLGETHPRRYKLGEEEPSIVQGLGLQGKTARDAMMPWGNAFTLSQSVVLDEEMLADVLVSGCSRIPVWKGNPNTVCGVLVVKRLILVDPKERMPLSDVGLHAPIIVSETTPLLTLFAVFQSARSHLAIVLPSDEEAGVARRLVAEGSEWPPELKCSGVVSIQDVFEELVQEDLRYEESDLKAAQVLANDSSVRARLQRLQAIGHKRLRDAVGEPSDRKELPDANADTDSSSVRLSSTPLGRALGKATSVSGNR